MELLVLSSLSVFLCKRSSFLTEVNQVWIAKEPQSHVFHLIFLLVFFLCLKKKSHCGLTYLLSQLEITGHLLFVKALFSLKRKEYVGTVIYDPGQSSTLAF